MRNTWKRLLIGCLVAVQCFSIMPAVNADQSVQQNNSTTTNLGPSTPEEAPVNPPAETPTDNEAEAPAETPVEQPEGTDQSVTVPNTNTNTNTTGQEKKPSIDTSIYGSDVLVIVPNSNVMVHNNVEYKAPQPVTAIKGVSYVSLRTLTDRFGFQLHYDNKTKESIISSGGRELRYKIGTNTYKVDGVETKMSGTSYAKDNTFMVPLTSALQAFGMSYRYEASTKLIIVQMTSAPVAKFSVVPKEIFATQTEVTVKDESYHPRGLEIVEQEWSGLETYYADPGQYTITLRVKDSNGVWSEPYSQTITVIPPNEPPVAAFETNKDVYKMGELITYQDLSTDEEDAIVERKWENNQKAFFKPGDYYVTLRVTDKHGASNEIMKKITITNETLYTFDEFNLLYTEVGEKYAFNGSTILNYKQIIPLTKHGQRTFYRSNSPESFTSDGILYQDKIAGATRVLMHHRNATNRNMKMYIVAKNISSENAVVRVERAGIAGPSTYPQETGTKAVARYFDSFRSNGVISEQILKPNESVVLVPDLTKLALKPEQVYSMYADFYSDNNLQYQIIALDASKDIMKELPKLEKITADKVHIRGTFNNADRTMTVSELVGDVSSRLLLADNKTDTYLTGWDTLSGESKINQGNYGVLYHIELQRVAPNTMISFNARAGAYAGAILVNGQTVFSPNNGLLNNSSESSVVYRTGNTEEKVDIWFTPAAGSSLPVNLVFNPMPEKRQ